MTNSLLSIFPVAAVVAVMSLPLGGPLLGGPPLGDDARTLLTEVSNGWQIGDQFHAPGDADGAVIERLTGSSDPLVADAARACRTWHQRAATTRARQADVEREIERSTERLRGAVGEAVLGALSVPSCQSATPSERPRRSSGRTVQRP